jgi:hypothetical protein
MNCAAIVLIVKLQVVVSSVVMVRLRLVVAGEVFGLLPVADEVSLRRQMKMGSSWWMDHGLSP